MKKKISEAEAIASLKQKLDEATTKTTLTAEEVEKIKRFPDTAKEIVASIRDSIGKFPAKILSAIRNLVNRILKRKTTKESINEGLGSILKSAFTSLFKTSIKLLGQAIVAVGFTLPIISVIADVLSSETGGPCLFLECTPQFFYFFGILKGMCGTIISSLISFIAQLPVVSYAYDGYSITVVGTIIGNPYLVAGISALVFTLFAIALIWYFYDVYVNWRSDGFLERVWNWVNYKDSDDSSDEYVDDDNYQYA